MYLIKKVSELSGVSVRTLHHYDEIGLLSPQKYENGYRYYSYADMDVLQAILFYKYLGFSLKEIKDLLKKDDTELIAHLKKQLILIKKEKQRLLTLIDTLEKTIQSNERRTTMSTSEKFKGFTYEDSKQYKQEAIEKYGKEVIEDSLKRQNGKEQALTDGFNKIFFSFSDNLLKGLKAADMENVKLAEKLHQHLCAYSFDCSLEIFSSIGYGYVKDERLKNNIDKFGEGTAQYVCDAIQEYVEKTRC